METIKEMNAAAVKAALEAMRVEARIAKRETLQACIGDLPMNALERVLNYGFQRFLNDGNGGKDVAPETKIALAQAKLARLLAGEVGRRVAVQRTDKDRFITNFVMQAVRAALRMAGKDTTILPTRASERFRFAQDVLARNPGLAERAEKAWEESQADTGVDLDGLGL